MDFVNIYISIIFSKLKNDFMIWSPFYTVHITPLEKIPSRFLRYFREDGECHVIGFIKDIICKLYDFDMLEQRKPTLTNVK